MRRTLPSLLLLVACGGPPAASTDDTDTDARVDDTRPPDTSDSDAVWDTGSEGGPSTRDTFNVTDEPLGPTALDGVWRGTFTLLEKVPLVSIDPLCEGFVEVTIDGDGDRHVVATFDCPRWTRSPRGLLGPYGPLEGIGFGTLDPSDLSRAFTEITLGAPLMNRADLSGVRMNFSGDTLTIDHRTFTGFGGLQSGHRLTATAVLGAPPPDTNPPPDTADTDVVTATADTADTDVVVPTGSTADTADTDVVVPTGDTALVIDTDTGAP